MIKTIEIQIDKDGKITIEGKGFTGRECDKKMEEFEKQLGSVKARTNKPEYSATVATTQKVGG